MCGGQGGGDAQHGPDLGTHHLGAKRVEERRDDSEGEKDCEGESVQPGGSV